MSAEEKYTYCIDKINSLAGNLLAGMLPNYGEDLVFKIENLVECLENTRLPESLEETFTVSFDFKNRDLRLLYKLSLQVDFVDTKDIPWVEILNIVGFQGDGKQHVDRFRRVIQGDSQEDKKEKKIGDQLYEIADKKSVKTVDFYHSPSNIFLDICYFFNVEDIIKGIDDVYLQKMPISEECKIFIKNLHNDYCTSLKKKRAKHPSQEVVNLERIENIAEKARNAGYYFINELRTLMHPMIFNRNLEFFIYLCRSVLRAENVIQRDFSDLLRNAEKSLQSQNKGIPELIQESFIYRPNEAYLVTEKIAEDFADMLKEYFAFNRKFDSVFEDSEGKIIMDGGRDLSASYMERYEIQRRSLEDFLNVDCIFPTYSMFPHIFKLLLEMTAVDYNFVLDSKRFKTLLDLDALLNGNISKGKDLEKFNNKKESQKIKGIIHMWKDIEKKPEIYDLYPLVNKSTVAELIKTLELINIKNRALIWKALQVKREEANTPHPIDKYEYLATGWVVRFKEGKTEKKFVVYKRPDDYVDYPQRNDIISGYEQSVSNNIKNPEVYTEYEKKYIGIKRGKNHTDWKKDYEALEEDIGRYESRDKEYSGTTYSDIAIYNNKVVRNIKEHFVGYGKEYIKKLKLKIGDSPDKEYLEIIREKLKKTSPEILSYAFIAEHIKWCLKITDDTISSDKEIKKDDFLYLEVVTMLLIHFRKLCKRIEQSSYYCLNFAPVFQDCFYYCEYKDGKIDSVRRNSFSTPDLPTFLHQLKNEFVNTVNATGYTNSKDWFFVASAWLLPIGHEKLCEDFFEFEDRKKRLEILLQDKYIEQQQRIVDDAKKANSTISDIQKEVKSQTTRAEKQINIIREGVTKKIDESKRTTVQTLGIFASFLALATVALGTFVNVVAHNLGGLAYVKIILSITLCLCVFVLLLDFVIDPNRQKIKHQVNSQRKNNTHVLSIAAVIAVLLIAFFSI